MGQDYPVMAAQLFEARDYFLACYVVSLVQNETILETPIKHATIKLYLAEAHKLFWQLPFESEQGFPQLILKSVKNYEEVPKRRRMTTDGMMQWLITTAARAGPDSLGRAIVD